MNEKLINDIINILDNVYYWETCPQEYNDKIDVIKKELKSELKKLRVTDVSGELPSQKLCRKNQNYICRCVDDSRCNLF